MEIRAKRAAGQIKPELNAKDAMVGHHATLKMATSTDQAGWGGVIVRIQDSGGGIEREHHPPHYDPFFKTTTKQQDGAHKGTGRACRQYGIMQEHAARSTIESELAWGTAFQLEFQFCPAPSRNRCDG